MHEVVVFLMASLRELYNNHSGFGELWAQLYIIPELALEEVFYGHTLGHTDSQLNVSLGSSINKNSVTH